MQTPSPPPCPEVSGLLTTILSAIRRCWPEVSGSRRLFWLCPNDKLKKVHKISFCSIIETHLLPLLLLASGVVALASQFGSLPPPPPSWPGVSGYRRLLTDRNPQADPRHGVVGLRLPFSRIRLDAISPTGHGRLEYLGLEYLSDSLLLPPALPPSPAQPVFDTWKGRYNTWKRRGSPPFPSQPTFDTWKPSFDTREKNTNSKNNQCLFASLVSPPSSSNSKIEMGSSISDFILFFSLHSRILSPIIFGWCANPSLSDLVGKRPSLELIKEAISFFIFSISSLQADISKALKRIAGSLRSAMSQETKRKRMR